MSSVVISGDSSGSVSLTVPSVAGTNTATLPAATGTVMVSGNMPAFSAYQSTLQALSNATLTKIQFQTEEFDTNNNFDSTTNYRFTPTVAGYYQISSTVNIIGVAGNNYVATIYKNGSEFKRGNQSANNTANNTGLVVSALIYLNGSTDYVEIYGYQGSGISQNTANGIYYTFFQGVMVRAA
jgi:hypothetical protein